MIGVWTTSLLPQVALAGWFGDDATYDWSKCRDNESWYFDPNAATTHQPKYGYKGCKSLEFGICTLKFQDPNEFQAFWNCPKTCGSVVVDNNSGWWWSGKTEEQLYKTYCTTNTENPMFPRTDCCDNQKWSDPTSQDTCIQIGKNKGEECNLTPVQENCPKTCAAAAMSNLNSPDKNYDWKWTDIMKKNCTKFCTTSSSTTTITAATFTPSNGPTGATGPTVPTVAPTITAATLATTATTTTITAATFTPSNGPTGATGPTGPTVAPTITAATLATTATTTTITAATFTGATGPTVPTVAPTITAATFTPSNGPTGAPIGPTGAPIGPTGATGPINTTEPTPSPTGAHDTKPPGGKSSDDKKGAIIGAATGGAAVAIGGAIAGMIKAGVMPGFQSSPTHVANVSVEAPGDLGEREALANIDASMFA